MHIDVTDERSLNDLIQKAKDAIARFKELVHDTVANAEKILGDKAQQIKEKAEKIIADTEQAIKNEVQKVKDNIEKIKAEAAILGVDIKECTAEHMDELEALPKSIIDKMIKCVTDELNKAINIIKSAVDDILKIKDELVNFPQKLKDCIASGNPVTCVSDLIGEIVKDISGVPTMIQDKINQITDLVNNIKSDLEKCALSKVIEVTKEAGAIGIKVAECVADKIREE